MFYAELLLVHCYFKFMIKKYGGPAKEITMPIITYFRTDKFAIASGVLLGMLANDNYL